MSKLEDLADALLEAQIASNEAKETFEEIKAEFISELKKQGKYDPSTKAIGNARVKITANRYFDLPTALTLVPKKVIKECEVTVVDPKKLKEHMSKVEQNKAMKSYDAPFKVGISVLED